ncbi:hypothetical protein SAMN05421504_1011483 [Amycolatopsis xylanica]|uniref:Transglutaminase-like domain-containing protein n=1 Tax=Amycolatopsis xylanica TaxID=589385 RepID=A0A1H2WBL9_9PSEU|nr:transglutaminase domain-containing protein [Amycolatopsis xylanica]SDW77925.1 hypothetical protein SAMN05421504_1011483 [Amycolatopsis xylanica]
MSTAVAPGLLTGAIGRFVQVPRDVARYETDVRTAASALRTAPEDIAALAAAGLSHVDDPVRGPLFDYDDIMNTGMFSGTGQTVPELGLRFLMRFAASPKESWYSPKDWLVGVAPAARLDGIDDGDTPTVRVRVPDLAAEGVEALPLNDSAHTPPYADEIQDRPYHVAVRLTGAARTVRDRRVIGVWTDIVDALTAGVVTYQTVPEVLRADHRRAWRLGMADCIVAAKLLAEHLTTLGLNARVRRGYLLGLFGSDHAWCELEEDGVWKPLDPVFAFVGAKGDPARGVAKSPEFAAACFGGRFNRLLPCVGEDAAPLVYFDEDAAPYWSMVGISAKPWRRS